MQAYDRARSIAINFKEYRTGEGTRRATEFAKGGEWTWGEYGVIFISMKGQVLRCIPWENILNVDQLVEGEYV